MSNTSPQNSEEDTNYHMAAPKKNNKAILKQMKADERYAAAMLEDAVRKAENPKTESDVKNDAVNNLVANLMAKADKTHQAQNSQQREMYCIKARRKMTAAEAERDEKDPTAEIGGLYPSKAKAIAWIKTNGERGKVYDIHRKSSGKKSLSYCWNSIQGWHRNRWTGPEPDRWTREGRMKIALQKMEKGER